MSFSIVIARQLSEQEFIFEHASLNSALTDDGTSTSTSTSDNFSVYYDDFSKKEPVMHHLLRFIKNIRDEPNSMTSIIGARLCDRSKFERCLETMRIIYKEGLRFLSQHCKLHEISTMTEILNKRIKLGGLTNSKDSNLKVFPTEVKGILTLLFFQASCGMYGDQNYLLMEKLNSAMKMKGLRRIPSPQTYTFCRLLEEIVDEAPASDKEDVCRCGLFKFKKRMLVVQKIIHAAMNVIKDTNMDGITLVAGMRNLKSQMSGIKERLIDLDCLNKAEDYLNSVAADLEDGSENY